MAYKYPYISDKKMYAAVMGACKYIRETGYFNKAVRYYAERYGVNEKELEKQIRLRQSAGQKGKAGSSAGKTYKWFIVVETCHSDAAYEYSISDPQVLKGISSASVVRRFSDNDWRRTTRDDYGGSYAPVYRHEAIAEFDTESEARKQLSDWRKYAKEKFGNRYYEPWAEE